MNLKQLFMDRNLIISILVFVLWLCVLSLLAMIPASMAKKRGRSYGGWWLFSIIFSFILGMLFVLALGETDEHRRQRIIEEERLRKSVQ